jgi:drug/metabolite transporter (DMT)-like permease
MTQKPANWKPYLALLTVYIIWGTTAGVIRLGVDTIPPSLLPCLRFLIAGTLLVTLCLLKGEPLPDRVTLKNHLITGLLLFFGGNSIICWTLKYVTTSFGGILVATTPFWMVGLSAILPPREKVPGMSLIGIAIGFVGMLILLSPKVASMNQTSDTSPMFWLCIAGLLLMTFFWALGSIYARKHPAKGSLMMAVGFQNIFAGLALLPICLNTIHDWSAIHPTGQSLFSLAYLVLLGTMVATPCYLYVVKHLPVSVSSTFAYVTPVFTIAFGGLFLGEPITPSMLLGASVILAGVILVQYMNRQKGGSRQPDKETVSVPSQPVEAIEQASCPAPQGALS